MFTQLQTLSLPFVLTLCQESPLSNSSWCSLPYMITLLLIFFFFLKSVKSASTFVSASFASDCRHFVSTRWLCCVFKSVCLPLILNPCWLGETGQIISKHFKNVKCHHRARAITLQLNPLPLKWEESRFDDEYGKSDNVTAKSIAPEVRGKSVWRWLEGEGCSVRPYCPSRKITFLHFLCLATKHKTMGLFCQWSITLNSVS